ncbi:hypothetical protein PF004_g3196 [Phytophthora fragariae]|uniref:Hexosyltransferase n=3 Tax=Phytophthora fragariae TaxID=53985 RepID=A0A6G0PMK3_9STRA|nr:hypothetical protein PF004_g3196 [Phytophthora fragariae]
MLYPLHDTIDTPPVKLSAKINVRQGGAQLFNELYRKTSLCFEVDNVTLGCSAIRSTRSEIKIQQLGRFSVRAFLSDVNGDEEPIGERYWLSPTVIFSLVRDSEFTSHLDMHAEARRNQLREDYDLSLVEWARQQQSQRDRRLLESLEEDEVGLHLSQARGGSQREDELVLLIGVKTAVATNFALRQAIRETWASKDALPDGVKVVFLGCRPIARVDEDVADENDWERRRLRDAIMLEKMVNGDLLTDELDCDDTYLDLANKVKEFFHLAAMRFGHAQSAKDRQGALTVHNRRMSTKIKTVVALLWLNLALCCSAGSLPPVEGNRLESSARDAEDVEDPVTAIRIIHPPDGAIEKPPVMFKTFIDLRPGTTQLFEALYEGGSLCLEANGEIVHCSPLDESTFWYHHLGNCTARAFLIRSGSFIPENRGSYSQSPPVTFTQVDEVEFNEHIAREIEKHDKRHRAGYQQSLVEWAETKQRLPDEEILNHLQSTPTSINESATDPVLVVGVRTAVVANFPFRQAIRETWASNAVLPHGVKVVFLGCRPYAEVADGFLDNAFEEVSLRRIWESVELEKQVYGDLSTDELDCDDSR